jgi:hypothetical protein
MQSRWAAASGALPGLMAMAPAGFSNAAASCILALHLVWILWVIFGAIWTRGRRWLTGFHLASLVWGIVVEIGPWPCPLTLAEDYFQGQATGGHSRGGFLAHFLASVVYPDLSVPLLTAAGVAVCCLNLGIYLFRLGSWVRSRAASQS